MYWVLIMNFLSRLLCLFGFHRWRSDVETINSKMFSFALNVEKQDDYHLLYQPLANMNGKMRLAGKS